MKKTYIMCTVEDARFCLTPGWVVIFFAVDVVWFRPATGRSEAPFLKGEGPPNIQIKVVQPAVGWAVCTCAFMLRRYGRG